MRPVSRQLVVADYKTDNIAPPEVDEVLERHRPQAALYAWAAHVATGLPVSEVVFVFARLGLA